MAVRLAMGASRRALVRQLLTESVLLGLLSGVAGMLHRLCGAAALIRGATFLRQFRHAQARCRPCSRLRWSSRSPRASCSAPFRLSRLHVASVAETLKEEARTTGRSRSKVALANALLVGQVAFSFLLLVTAALFLRSIGRAYDMNPGFQTAHLAVFMTNPGQAGYGKPQIKAFDKDVRERVARMPGVESVSWASNMPLWARSVSGLQVEGHQTRSQADKITTIVNTVDTDYFETAGVAIESGREFTNLDQENSTPVAIVNEKLAHDYWPGGDRVREAHSVAGRETDAADCGSSQKRQLYQLGRGRPTLRLCASGTELLGGVMSLYVRSWEIRRQILIPVQREIHAAAPQIVDQQSANRARDHRWRLVRAENGRRAAKRVRAAGARPGKHRPVRHPGLFGQSAKTGDRIAHGFRRGPDQRASADSEARHVAGHDRRADRLGGGAAGRAPGEQDAVWRKCKRSDQRSGSGSGAVGGRAVGLLSSGSLGQPRRSVGGLTRGLIPAMQQQRVVVKTHAILLGFWRGSGFASRSPLPR